MYFCFFFLQTTPSNTHTNLSPRPQDFREKGCSCGTNESISNAIDEETDEVQHDRYSDSRLTPTKAALTSPELFRRRIFRNVVKWAFVEKPRIIDE